MKKFILPFIFLTFTYLLEPILSTSNDSFILLFGYSFKGEYDSKKYQYNLHNLLGTLSSQTSISSFSNFTTTSPNTLNQLHGIYLCRGDVDPRTCKSCINSARTYILTHYPYGREGLMWYNKCMIRYSNQPFLGKFDQTMWTFIEDIKKVEGNRVRFMNSLGRIMKGLAIQASKNENRFASRVVKLRMDYEALNLQAMAQCTPDLANNDCYRCLTYANDKMLNMNGSTFGKVLYKSCFVQYKTTFDFNNRNEALPPPSTTASNLTLLKFSVKVNPISFLNKSSLDWTIKNSSCICLKVRFNTPPFRNNTVNSTLSTLQSWEIANLSSSTSHKSTIKLKGTTTMLPDNKKGSKEWDTT